MNYKLVRTVMSLVLAAVFLGVALVNFTSRDNFTVLAVGDLTVSWGVPEGDPIFVVTNMKPGDTEQRTVTVTNDASRTRAVGVRGVMTSGDGLENGLNFEITTNTTVYDNSLMAFFTETANPEDSVLLFTLEPGESRNVTFTGTLPEGAGNEYQGKSVVFDLIIGISSVVPEQCVGMGFSGGVFYGTDGNDTLTGTSKNDLIFGFEGNDTVIGNGGNDCIVAGSGNDNVTGGNGNDKIFGEDGNDIINGNGNVDYISGGAGNDILNGGDNRDVIDGGEGNDTINGMAKADLLNGGPGDDTIRGGEDADRIFGDNGDDTLYGEDGNDLVVGGAGEDSADGGPFIDRCEAETELNCEIDP